MWKDSRRWLSCCRSSWGWYPDRIAVLEDRRDRQPQTLAVRSSLSGTGSVRQPWQVQHGAIALLPAPLLARVLASAFSLTPPLFTIDNKVSLLLTSLTAGLLGGLFEEIEPV